MLDICVLLRDVLSHGEHWLVTLVYTQPSQSSSHFFICHPTEQEKEFYLYIKDIISPYNFAEKHQYFSQNKQ